MTLRDLAMLRPPLRSDAMDVLLSLTTHSDRPTRGAAILTIKRWVPDVQPLAQMGLDFALHLLKRLETGSASSQGSTTRNTDLHDTGTPAENGSGAAMDLVVADGEKKVDQAGEHQHVKTEMADVEGGKVVGGMPVAQTEQEVAQHVELLLGLVSKSPGLLDE